jgi:hypothetical protein
MAALMASAFAGCRLGLAVTMADATGVTMGVVVATGIGHTGAWIVLTILVVV